MQNYTYKKIFGVTVAALLIAGIVLMWFVSSIGAPAASAAAATDVKVWNGIDGTTADADYAFSGGSGTDTDPYLISTAADLSYLAVNVNANGQTSGGLSFSSAYYKMTADIYINDISRFAAWGGDYIPENTWTPIGNSTNAFEGGFDGGGYTVFGIYINDVKGNFDYIGLFGYVSGTEDLQASVHDVTMRDFYIAGKHYIGGIAGKSYLASFDNCVSGSGKVVAVYGTIKTSVHMGGLFGYVLNSESLTGCVNGADVCGDCQCAEDRSFNYDYIGGIAAGIVCDDDYHLVFPGSAGTDCSDCSNTGSVEGSGEYTGGVAGYVCGGSLTNCFNSGDVTGSMTVAKSTPISDNPYYYDYYTGGIVGLIIKKLSLSPTLSNCYNTGRVKGYSYIGGVAGSVQNGAVMDSCYNAGSVVSGGTAADGSVTDMTYGANKVGAIAGGCVGLIANVESSGNSYVRNSFNTGDVSGYAAGGLAGDMAPCSSSSYHYIDAYVYNSYNTGTVEGTYYAGGLVGYVLGNLCNIFNNYNTGTVSPNAHYYGALFGYFKSGWAGKDYYLSGCCANVTGYTYYGTTIEPYAFESSGDLTSSVDINSTTYTTLFTALNAWVDQKLYDYPYAVSWISGTYPVFGGTYSDATAWDGSAASCFAGGSGTETDPYLISSAYQLKLLADTINGGASKVVVSGGSESPYASLQSAHYKLTNDISLNDETFKFDADTGLIKISDGYNTVYMGTGYPGDGSGDNSTFDTTAGVLGTLYMSDDSTGESVGYDGALNYWTPIGTSSESFKGSFDGGGYTIRGLYVYSTSDYQGLFGDCVGATIENVSVAGSVKGAFCVGGIAGAATDGSEISNCFSDSTVIGSQNVGGIAGTVNKITCSGADGRIISSGDYCGGLAGVGTSSCFGNVYNYADVSGAQYAGGISGCLQNNENILDAFNFGSVSGTNYVGGISGLVNSGSTVYCCYNSGAVTGSTDAGAVAGANEGTLTYCYYFSGSAASGVGSAADITGQCTAFADYTTAFDHDGNAETADVTLESVLNDAILLYYSSNVSASGLAGWETFNTYPVLKMAPKRYALTLNYGYEDTVFATVYVENGEKYLASKNLGNELFSGTPSRSGYAFEGFYTSSTDGRKVLDADCSPVAAVTGYTDSNALFTLTSSATLYAQWILSDPAIDTEEGYDGIYDGEPHYISVSVTSASDDFTYTYQWYKGSVAEKNAIDGATGASYGVEDVADSGDYYCVVSVTDGNETESKSGDAVSVSIAAMSITLTINDIATGTYVYGDGAEHTTTATYDSLYGSDTLTYELSYSDKVNAGTCNVSISSASISNGTASNYDLDYSDTGTVVIDRKPVTLTVTDVASGTYTYDGEAHTTTATYNLLCGTDTLEYSLYYSDNKNAGTCTVSINSASVLNGTASNYIIDRSDKGTMVIDPKLINITVNDDTCVYDGSAHKTTAACDSLCGTDSMSYTLAYSDNINAGDCAVTISGASVKSGKAANYEFDCSDTGTITISPKEIILTVRDLTSGIIYDGTAHTTTAFYTALCGYNTLAYTLSYDGGNIDAGIHTVSISSASVTNGLSSNYILDYSDTGTLTIAQRTIEIAANDTYSYYGDADADLTYRLTSGGVISGDSLTGSLERESGNGAASNYYLIYSDRGTLTIDPKPITFTVTDVDARVYTYDGTAHTTAATYDSLCGDDTLTYGLVYSDNVNAGTCNVSISYVYVTGGRSSNYAMDYSDTGTMIIAQRAITVTADDVTAVYGSGDVRIPYAVTSGSLVAGDVLSGALSREPGTDAGTYAITLGTLSDRYSDYDITFVGGATYTILAVNVGSTETPTEDDVDASAYIPTGTDPNAVLEVKEVSAETVDDIEVPDGKEAVDYYNAALYIGDNEVETDGDVILSFDAPEGFDAAECTVLVCEDGGTVALSATCVDGIVTFTMPSTLGNFILLATPKSGDTGTDTGVGNHDSVPTGMSAGAIAGTVIGSVFGALLIAFIILFMLWWRMGMLLLPFLTGVFRWIVLLFKLDKSVRDWYDEEKENAEQAEDGAAYIENALNEPALTVNHRRALQMLKKTLK